MHALFIITDYGSFNNFLGELAVELSLTNHRVSVICDKNKVIDYDDKFEYEKYNIEFHFTTFPRGFNVFKQYLSSKNIYQIVKNIKPDFIHAHFTTGIFTAVFYKKLSYTTIGTFHGLGFPSVDGLAKKILYELIEKFCFSRLDKIYVLNNSDYKLLKPTYKHKVSKYQSFGLGCDINKFSIANYPLSLQANIRSKLGIDEHAFVFSFVGRFVSFKGFHLVVCAFLKLLEKTPKRNFELLLIGGADDAHFTGLTEEETNKYKSCKKIHVVGFTANVDYYLSITDTFVFPSVKEGMPVCIMEALAMGIPVITSDARGCNDLVEDNINGLLLSANPTVDEVCEAMGSVLENDDLLIAMTLNSLAKRAELSRSKYIAEQIEIYKTL